MWSPIDTPFGMGYASDRDSGSGPSLFKKSITEVQKCRCRINECPQLHSQTLHYVIVMSQGGTSYETGE